MFQTTGSIVAPMAALGTEVLSNQTFIPGYYSAASVTPASDVASGNDTVEYVGSLDAPYVAELNGSPPRLIRTMYVGGPSAAVLFDPLTGDLYALHESPGNLTVVDAETGSILANLAVGLYPGNLVLPAGLALDTTNNEIFASAYSSLSIISGSSLKVIGNAWVGYDTAGVAFDAANGDLYVPNQASGNISVINGSTWKSLASISAGPQPASPDAVAVDDATNEIYVANFDITIGGLEQPGDLLVISGKNQSVVSTISLQDAGNYPWGVAVAPVSHTVYFSCATWNEIGEVSTTNYTQFRTMKWSGIPDSLGVNAGSGLLFSPAGWTGLPGGPGEGIVRYANATTNASLLGSVTVGASPSGLAVDPNLNELFVDDAYSGNLTVLNATSLAYMGTIPVGTNSERPPYYYPPVVRGIVYDPVSRLVFVANPMDRTLSVINASSRLVDHTESAYGLVDQLVLDPAENVVFATYDSNFITGYNGSTGKLIGNITVCSSGACAAGAAFVRESDELYLSSASNDSIEIVNVSMEAVVAWLHVPGGAYGLASDSADRRVFAADPASGEISIINTLNLSVIGNVSVGKGSQPETVYWDDSSAHLFVVSRGNSSLTIMNLSGNILQAMPLPGSPSEGLLVPVGNRFDVADTSSDSISVFGSGFKLSVSESGLPSGRDWRLDLGGTEILSLTSGFSLLLPNGTYSYSIAPVGQYFPTPSHGVIIINGSPALLVIHFGGLQFPIAFNETGLPTGTEWWVNLSSGSSFDNDTPTISFAEPNGTYDYTISNVNRTYQAPGGFFKVNGMPVSVTVPFGLVYAVTFTESGLPSDTEWWVNITNGQSFNSTTDTIGFNEPNGTYSYTLATLNKNYSAPGGTFRVNGVAVSRVGTFSLVTYGATFTESGLPSGTEWWVNVSGQVPKSSTGTTITLLNLPNGTYIYSVATSNKLYSVSGGSFQVDGAAVSRSLTFSLVTYTVTFTELGLPSGTTWWVNITNGEAFGGTGKAISFTEPNGTYTYSIATSDKSHSVSGGSFAVDGHAISMSVTFLLVKYSITFTEGGLPSGTTWSVTMNGGLESSSTTSIVFTEPNDTYSFTIGSVSGYSSNVTSGSVNVAGTSMGVSITFSTTTTNSTPSGGFSKIDWIIIGVVVAAIAGVGAASVAR